MAGSPAGRARHLRAALGWASETPDAADAIASAAESRLAILGDTRPLTEGRVWLDKR
jgi:predicted ATPase